MIGLFLLAVPSADLVSSPSLRFESPELQRTLGAAFEGALDNLLIKNTVPSDPKVYNQSGLMRENRFFRAGGGYQQPWTRDAAVNSLFAGSLFAAPVARDTLWSVTVPDASGQPIVQRDNQWWDKVVWIVAAENHYKVTGDRQFLQSAYGVSTRLLREMRATRFSAREGLFKGPSFFNDGIAGYPSPPADPGDKGSSFVLDHQGSDELMALSTNCLYVGAYRTAARMAKELRQPTAEWTRAADALKGRINRRFWMREKGQYAYLLYPDGKMDRSQEGSGVAFAILFDVASPSQARSLMRSTHVEPFGIVDVYPHFQRFSDERPGRHNAIVWPMVQGLWAQAAAKMRDAAAFERETRNLARLVEMSGGRFFEIYNAKTGKVDGGWQNNFQWGSEPEQTWSATAYLNMITHGLFGMRFEADGLRFEPMLPKSWGDVRLDDVPYRAAMLDLQLRGHGARVASVQLDGKKVRWIPSLLKGKHSVLIQMR